MDEADEIDPDADGLSFPEFCALVREREPGEHTDGELHQRFLAADIDGSGRVSKAEYMRFALRDTLSRSVTRIKEIFAAWDEDGDGLIDAAEFRRAVRALGLGDVSNRELDLLFREFDEDGSGQVSRFELDRKLRKVREDSIREGRTRETTDKAPCSPPPPPRVHASPTAPLPLHSHSAWAVASSTPLLPLCPLPVCGGAGGAAACAATHSGGHARGSALDNGALELGAPGQADRRAAARRAHGQLCARARPLPRGEPPLPLPRRVSPYRRARVPKPESSPALRM